MPASTEQKVDFLLKKIGYTASKSGIAEDSSLSGTKKAPFAEAIPSPLATPSSNIWADSTLIPATPPGSDTAYVKGYRTATALRMTADSSVSGSRAFIAYTTYNNTSTPILGDWIDTQFGADYIVKVYKGDPNSSGVQLSAAGAGSNDTWFFDYASGVLNFNGTQIPSGVTDTNIYIVAYRYIGAKGARPAAGIATFKDLYVTGLSTFVGVGTFNSHLYVGGNLEVKGTTAFNGGTITLGDAANDNVVFGADVDSNIIPDDDDTYDLGSTGQQWRNLYLDGLADLDNVNIAETLNVVGVSTFNEDVNFIGAAHNAQWDKSANELKFNGNAHAVFGSTNLLELRGDWNTGSSILNSSGTLYLDSVNNVRLRTGTNKNALNAIAGGSVELYYGSTPTKVLETTAIGVNVIGNTETDTLNVTGVSTFAGITTVTGTDLFTKRLNVSGVSTFTGISKFDDDVFVNDRIYVDNILINGNSIIAFTGQLQLDTTDGSGVEVNDNFRVTGVSTFTGNIDINSPLVDIDGHLEVDNVHVAGVTTFTGAIDANSSIDVAGTSTLNDDVTFTGAAANVVWDKSDNRLEFADNASIGIGNDDDLELSHDGTTSLIRDKRGSGSSLKIGADSLTLQNKDGNEAYLVATDNGSVDIYYDFSKKFSTTGIGVSVHNGVGNTATIAGPSNLIIDPGVVGDDTGSVRIKGNLYVDGAQFTVASGTIELEDHVVGIATTAGTNALLDGGGIGIGSANIRKTLLWNNASGALKSSENFDLLTGKVYKINGTSVLSNTTLGTTVVDSSLKNLGTLIDLDVAGITTFNGNIDANANLDVDGQTDLDVLNVSEAATFSSSIDVDGQTELDHLNVAGVSTFTGIARFNGDIDANGHVDIDGHTELDNVNISGVSTLTTLRIGNTNNITSILDEDNLGSDSATALATQQSIKAYVDSQVTAQDLDFQADTGGALSIDLDSETLSVVGTSYEVETAGSGNQIQIGLPNNVVVSSGLTATNLSVTGVSTLTTLRIGNTNNITHIRDEDNMASDSATSLATQQSIKAYVDSQVTAQDLDFQADTGGALSIDLDSEVLGIVGTSYEIETAGSGNNVTIGLPNNVVVSSGLTATNLSITGVSTFTGAIDANGHVDIDGHLEVDNVNVAGVSTLTTLRIGNTNNITSILDEDNMASNSATALATQQSIKAYVDTQITSEDLDFAGDSGTGAVDLDSQSLTIAGTSNEIETSASGQTLTIGLPNNVTIGNNLTVTAILDVDGHTELDNLNVAGVSTFGGTLKIPTVAGTNNAAFQSVLFQTAAGIIDGGSGLQYHPANDQLAVNGLTITSGAVYSAGGTSLKLADANHSSTQYIDISNKIDMAGNVTVTSGLTALNANITGVSTFAGAIDANGNLDVDGQTDLDHVNISGVSTLTTLRIGNTNNINSILDEDNMASNSATALATQQSIKAYVDSSVTAQDLDVSDGSNAIDIDLDSETLTIAGTSNEIETSASGTTVTIGLPNDVTIGNNLNVTAKLDVDGHTELDNVNVSGIVTTTNLTVGVGGTTITTQNTTSRVGINSTSPAYMLDVGGIINSSTDVKINGVSVVTQEAALNDAVAMAIALG